jgi:cytochrome c-type biogenesis protein CcmH/NrfG
MLKHVTPGKTLFDFDPLSALMGAGGGASLWAGQGKMCVERGDLFGALQSFQRSLEIDIDCLEAWTGLSEVFARMQDPRRVDACLEVARRICKASAREATA